jgi:hypothetical protein
MESVCFCEQELLSEHLGAFHSCASTPTILGHFEPRLISCIPAPPASRHSDPMVLVVLVSAPSDPNRYPTSSAFSRLLLSWIDTERSGSWPHFTHINYTLSLFSLILPYPQKSHQSPRHCQSFSAQMSMDPSGFENSNPRGPHCQPLGFNMDGGSARTSHMQAPNTPDEHIALKPNNRANQIWIKSPIVVVTTNISNSCLVFSLRLSRSLLKESASRW